MAKPKKGVSPQTLDDLVKAVDDPAQAAAAGVLRAKLPFEADPSVAQGDRASAPLIATIPYANGHKAAITDDPADPHHFGFSVTNPHGQPVNVPNIPDMDDGHATLNPTQIPEALKEVEKLDRKTALSFTDRIARPPSSELEVS